VVARDGGRDVMLWSSIGVACFVAAYLVLRFAGKPPGDS
jgi:hypothetical protein